MRPDGRTRGLLLVSALLACIASAYLLLAPVQVYEVTARTVVGDRTQVTTIRGASWLEVQGVSGVLVVGALGLLYGGAALAGAAGRTAPAVGVGAMAALLTLLASLSVGPLYYPAMVAMAAAGVFGLLRRRFLDGGDSAEDPP